MANSSKRQLSLGVLLKIIEFCSDSNVFDCQVYEAMGMQHSSNTVWAAPLWWQKQRLRNKLKSQKKVKGMCERLRRWFSGCIWCCECSTKLRLTEQCLLCRPCDDMFNQERHVGLRVSSWSFQFFCVPAVIGGYGVQTTSFILHLAYLSIE